MWMALSSRSSLDAEGFRNIAFLNGPPQYSNSRDRLKGYSRALNEAGIVLDETLLFEGNFSRKSGYARRAGRREAGPY